MWSISLLQQCAIQGLLAKGCPALVQLAFHGLRHLAQQQQAGLGCQRTYAAAAAPAPFTRGLSKYIIELDRQLVLSSRGTASISSSSAPLHSAALADHISDDENKQELPAFNPQLFPPHYTQNGQHQHHHAGHSNNHRSNSVSSRPHNHNSPHHHHQPHRQAGELHAAHGRRHATSSSGGGQPDALSDLLLSCKGLGVLRRVMLKYKANMGPQQIANTLLCLQHLVREARRLSASGRRGIRMPVELAAEEHASRQVQRRHGGVRAAQEFSRATARAAESDGPREQLVAQMMGELGNMIWHHMGDMSVHDLSKLLYSWARMDWHPEQKLLADVTTSFVAAADAAAGSQALQQSYCPGYILAAGLWGLAKLGEPISGATLALLKQQWRSLLPHWSQQQLADLAWALAAAADEIMAADMLEQQHQCDLKDLAPLVLGLADRLAELQRLQQQAQQAEAAADGTAGSTLSATSSGSPAKCAWPEVLLKETPAAAAATAAGKPLSSLTEDPVQVAAGTAWRMLQSLAAVGVNVSEPTDPRVGEVVAVLSHSMHLPKVTGSW